MMNDFKKAHCFEDFREIAKARLPRGFFEFIDRGNDDEIATQNNLTAVREIKLHSRVLNNVAPRNQSIQLFGQTLQMPVIIGPTGSAGLSWYEGEIALAKAAKTMGIPFTLATASMTSMEKIRSEAGGTLWFQLYLWPDRSLSHQLVKRAHDNGFEALVFTVDTPVAPGREYNLKNGFTIPFKFTTKNFLDILTHPRWLFGVIGQYLIHSGMPTFANFPAEMHARITALPMGRTMPYTETLSWEDVKELRKLWSGKLIIKGIQHAQDAKKAIAYGADAIIISNHGGRVLDSAPPTIRLLPGIVDSVNQKIPVLIDSGFRRGADVIKAMAMGADAVFLGRAPLYGVGAGGQEGAERVLNIYRHEIDRVLALIGCKDINHLNPENIFKD